MERISRPAVLTVLVATFVLGQIGFTRGEIYPFAPWDMFSRTPSIQETFRIRLHRLGERDFEPPQYLTEIPEFQEIMKNPINLVVIRKFGRAFVDGDASAGKLRPLMEESLGIQDAVYELVQVRYDVLVRYRTGEFSEAPLEIFEGSAAQP